MKLNRLWILLALALMLSACGNDRYPLTGTDIALAADGEVEVEEQEGNIFVMVRMQHLPPPQRINGPQGKYLVWFVNGNAQPVKAGVLNFDPDERTGNLTATNSHRGSFTVLVTCEKTPAASFPGEKQIAKRKVPARDS